MKYTNAAWIDEMASDGLYRDREPLSMNKANKIWKGTMSASTQSELNNVA